MGFLAPFAGSLLTGLFSKSPGLAADDASTSYLENTLAADSAQSTLTNTAISHQTTKFAQQVWTADEHVREASLYSEFTLGVEGAEQNVVKKSMTLVDQASQNG